MKKVARFEKVSKEVFYADYLKMVKEDNLIIIDKIYNDISLPKRATIGSAGYDFYAPFPFVLKKRESILIPTGIRCFIDEGYLLSIVPRSGLGFKYRVQLDNTIGVIDSDYVNSKNEGHIMIKISCDSYSDTEALIRKGDAIAQGLFLEFGITYDDEVTSLRDGGFGSTNKK